MSDTETPVTASFTLSPRLARLVGSNKDADQNQIRLRPSLPGASMSVSEVEERFSESDKPYSPRTDDTDVRPEEPRPARRQALVREESALPKTVSETPHPRSKIPEPETRIDVPPPYRERDSGLSDDFYKVQTTPHPGMLRPPPVTTHILAEKSTNLSKIQSALAPAATTSEPLQATHETTETLPELLPVPAMERKVERLIKTVPAEDMPRLDTTDNVPDNARKEPSDIPLIRPEKVEVTAKPLQDEQAKYRPHVPGITTTATQSRPTEYPAPRIIPVAQSEQVQPPSPAPLTAKIPEPKRPIRVEIGALNITLRQPDPPRARPALSIARKAPRAHTIPLRGFGED